MELSITSNFHPLTNSIGGNRLQKNKKKFERSQRAWALNIAASFVGMPVGAKTENPRVAQATTKISKSISGGKVLSLTNQH